MHSMHEAMIQNLLTAARNHTLAHTLILTGPDGIGKSDVARTLSAELLSCDSHTLATHPEYIHLQSEEGVISIDHMRALIARLPHTSLSSTNRVVVIEHIERATVSAANALLKSIEEPREKTFFILTATHTQTIPATVISRCATIFLPHVSNQELASYVEGFEPQLAQKMLIWAAGRPALLHDIAHKEDVRGQWLEAARDLFTLLTSPHDKRLAWVEAIPKNTTHYDMVQKIDQYTVMLRALIFSHAQKNPQMLAHLAHAIDRAVETKIRMEKHVQQRGLLDMFVLSLPRL